LALAGYAQWVGWGRGGSWLALAACFACGDVMGFQLEGGQEEERRGSMGVGKIWIK